MYMNGCYLPNIQPKGLQDFPMVVSSVGDNRWLKKTEIYWEFVSDAKFTQVFLQQNIGRKERRVCDKMINVIGKDIY